MGNSERGQALVEMAIISPILIMMLLGMFEVGWYIRAYMVTLQASREAARFLSKEGIYTPEQAYDHFLVALADQVPFDGTVLIRMHDIAYNNPFTAEDDVLVVREPLIFGDGKHTPIMDNDELVTGMIAINQTINQDIYRRELSAAHARCQQGIDTACRKEFTLVNFKTDPCETWLDWTQERLIVVEASYDNPQLLGFFGTHKIPVTVHTAIKETRSRWMPPRVIPFGDGLDGLEVCRE